METPSQIEEEFFMKNNFNLEAALKKAEQTIEKLLFDNERLQKSHENISKVNGSLQRDIQRAEAKLESKEKELQFTMEEHGKVGLSDNRK